MGDYINMIASNADEASSIVLDQAIRAAAQGTFAVGGCIIDNATGKILHAMHNNVLKQLKGTTETFTFDPTAHGERQLVSWYYANKVKLKLPEPYDLTIVTTLDPCVMCTGALLTAGFNVAIVAIDDFAGINYNGCSSFEALPPSLRDIANSKFGYYACGVEGQDPPVFVRNYKGGESVAFKSTIVSTQRLMGCGNIFQASVNAVRASSSESGLPPNQLKDPSILPDDAAIKARFREIYPDAFNVKTPVGRLPDSKLHSILIKVMESEPNAKNAVALLDPFGNLVLCLPDTIDESPIQTAFMNVTQAYARVRFDLMDHEDTRLEATKFLTHPKYGTFVFLYAPSPVEATTIMTLGAYGSTMEGPVPISFPSNFQYFNPPHTGTVAELRAAIMNLPPFYTQLAQISIMEVAIPK